MSLAQALLPDASTVESHSSMPILLLTVDGGCMTVQSRFGGAIYGTTGACFEIPRPPKEEQDRLKPPPSK